MRNSKVSFGADLPAETVEEFDRFVEGRGYLKWRAAQAAFRLLQECPLEIADALMRGDLEEVRSWFAHATAAMLARRVKEASQSAPPRPKGQKRAGDAKAGGKG